MATPGTPSTRILPTAVIVGRANVGKSSLFNKLIESEKALVSNIAGTTRTNNEGEILWRGKNIRLVDTGGPDNSENERFIKEIIKQSEVALAEADVIIFVADGRTGILPQERELIKKIRAKNTVRKLPIIFVANKCDKPRSLTDITSQEWLSLGLGAPLGVSAASGRGLGDLLDLVYAELNKKNRPKVPVAESAKRPLRVSLIGKPNVGKSSLFNKLIGEDRVIVSPIAHTTREPFDTTLQYVDDNKKKHTITFVDTAGIRRKSKVEGVLERQGVSKSIETIEKSDIVLIVLDASEPLSSQDLQLGGLLERHSRSTIIVLNKWDLTDDPSDAHRHTVTEKLYKHFPHLKFAPIVFVSGLTGYRVHQIFPLIVQVEAARQTIVETRELDDFLHDVVREHRPARGKGTNHPTLIGLRQLGASPPVFELFIKYRTSLHLSYVHFLENKLREKFNFFGTPIVIKLTKMKR